MTNYVPNYVTNYVPNYVTNWRFDSFPPMDKIDFMKKTQTKNWRGLRRPVVAPVRAIRLSAPPTGSSTRVFNQLCA